MVFSDFMDRPLQPLHTGADRNQHPANTKDSNDHSDRHGLNYLSSDLLGRDGSALSDLISPAVLLTDYGALLSPWPSRFLVNLVRGAFSGYSLTIQSRHERDICQGFAFSCYETSSYSHTRENTTGGILSFHVAVRPHI